MFTLKPWVRALRLSWWGVLGCSLGWSAVVAQEASLPHTDELSLNSAAKPLVHTGQAGVRLGIWLRQMGWVPGVVEGQGYNLSGLMLNRQALKAQQALQKTQLLTALYMAGQEQQGAESIWLSRLVQNLPVTGRLPLLSSDAEYLQLHPVQDPVLQPDDQMVLPPQTQDVVLIGAQGVCALPYALGADASVYARACFEKDTLLSSTQTVDQVWVVQPTGQVLKVKIANWNAQDTVVPMPGAWILAPTRDSQVPVEQWSALANYLSTQGPAHVSQSADWPRVSASAKRIEQELEARPLEALRLTSNDFGLVGVLQTPSARMRPAGSFTMTASRVSPYTRYGFILQPFDWLEAGFRYSRITNRLYGPRSFSGDQTYLDKNIDFKLRLHQETAWLPELSVGFQDIGGTGLFSGEYLVGSKRLGQFDVSLGLGWGYLGAKGSLSNPLGVAFSSFKTRPDAVSSNGGNVGQLSTKTFFRGRVAPFGGIQWQTPWPRWIAKVELDGNDYRNEPLSNPQDQTSRINYGLVYKLNKHVDVGMSLQRGTTLGFVLSLHEDLSKFNTPKLFDPAPISPVASKGPNPVNWEKTLNDVQAQTDWEVTSVEQRGGEVRLNVRNSTALYPSEMVNRASAVLNRDLPDSVNWFSLNHEQNGLEVGQQVVDRRQWVRRQTEYVDNGYEATDAKPEQVSVAPNSDFSYQLAHEKDLKRWTSRFGPGFQQIVGGSDGYLYQFDLVSASRLNLSRSTWADALLSYKLFGNFDSFKQPSDSRLPHVRTEVRQYATASDFAIRNLQLSHVGQMGSNWFYSAYGGLLEDMFAGVGGEVLYRPFGSRLALGVDVNSVRQRGYKKDFELLPYHVNTGHVTAYWDTGWNDVLAKVSVGQYLAGDRGVTVDISREFANGVTMGAFATKTNVSAADFGEGSFDKGIYVSIPFSSFFMKTLPGQMMFAWKPLTRDGGAKLNRTVNLYDQTQLRDPRTLEWQAAMP